jgi:Rps23 Pro-64 3,4-dihydroxylase Tpa1-like proline 4-hydroxylase
VYQVSIKRRATENDGGNLDLFCTENDSQSTPSHKVGKSISPVFNSIAFFEVSHKSFHQVAEVFSDIKGPRLSISGWFHGKTPLPPPQMPLIKGPIFYKCNKLFSTRRGTMNETYTLQSSTSVFNPLYTKQGVISQMKKSFTRDASLQLDGFLQPGIAKSIRSQFGSEKYDWVPIGPINQQSFRIMNLPLSRDSISDILSSQSITYPKTYSFQTFVYEQLLSETFYELICNTTGLKFDQVSIQIRCFSHGDYTMLTDPHYKASTKKKKAEAVAKRALEAVGKINTLEVNNDKEEEEEEDRDDIDNKSSFVEVNLCLATPPDYTCTSETSEWPEEAGGYVSYMTEDDQLLCVPPKENSLSLVLKEPGVMSFVKFVTSDAPGPRYDINFLFRVKSL